MIAKRPELDPVLIVDVNPLNRMLVDEMLRLMGYETIALAEWAGARARLGTRRPGMVLLDLDVTRLMPDDWDPVLAPADGPAPVIVGMCTSEDSAILAAFRDAGVDVVLQKPLDPAELANALESLRGLAS